MATLRMAGLWRDPRTGIWKLNRRIPQRYRVVAGRKGISVKISTGTADRKTAEARLPEVLSKWTAMEAEWEQALNGGIAPRDQGRPLTNKEVHALAGRWYRERLQEFEDDPAAAEVWDGWDYDMPSNPYPEGTCHREILDGTAQERPEYRRHEAAFLMPFLGLADDVLKAAHVSADDASRERLARLLVQRLSQALQTFSKHLTGDYSPDPIPATFPEWQPATAAKDAPKAPSVPLTELFNSWKGVASVKPRVIEETRYTIEALKAFLKHDDAAAISKDDMLRWRKAMLNEGRTNDTWNNRLSMVRQVLKWGVNDGKLTANVTDGLRLQKGRAKSWLPYSDDDAARILSATRVENRPSLRWAHWIMAFTGMRAGEVLQLTQDDVRRDGDVPYLLINQDDPTKSVKNSERRSVPIHPALVAEGFLDYVATIPPNAPLFPDKRLDQFGHRGGRAWNVIGQWVRNRVGITDKRKAPDHSWRHRLEDELRSVEAPEDVRDAIMGHTRKTTGRLYGVRGEALKRLYEALVKVKSPVKLPSP